MVVGEQVHMWFLVRVRMTSTFYKVTGRRKVTLLSFASREQCQGLLPLTTVHQLWTFLAGFFTDEVWAFLVAETNRYAARCRQQNTLQRERPWTDVTVVETKAFVGILFHMGISKLPELEMYWSQTYPLLAQPVSELILFNHSQQIPRFLHLNDSDQQVSHGQPGYDACCLSLILLHLGLCRSITCTRSSPLMRQ